MPLFPMVKRTLPLEHDELPEWVQPPSHMVARMKGGHIPSHLVRVHVPQRRYTILLDVSSVSPRSSIQQQISQITGVSEDAVRVTHENGQDLEGPLQPGQTVMISLPMERAGMQRSMSSTMPFENHEYTDENSDTSEEMHSTWWRDQVESTGAAYDSSPQRTSSRSRSPATSLARGSASPTRHSWHSSALPQELPPAQAESVARPAIDNDRDIPIGYIWANPSALVSEVQRAMRRDLSIAVDIRQEPEGASAWHQVQRLSLSRQPDLGVPYYTDLRIDRWELYQIPRPIPVMDLGRIVTFVVVPQVSDLQTVQARVERWQGIVYHRILMALDTENWVILRRAASRCIPQSHAGKSLSRVKEEA